MYAHTQTEHLFILLLNISTVPRHKTSVQKVQNSISKHLPPGVWEKQQSQPVPTFFPMAASLFPQEMFSRSNVIARTNCCTMQGTSPLLEMKGLCSPGILGIARWPTSLGALESTNRLRKSFSFHHCCFLRLQQQMPHIVTAFRTNLSARHES